MKRFAIGTLIGFLLATLFSAPWVYQAYAVGSCAVFRTWNTGDSVTAADLNSSFTTAAVTNSTPQCLDDYSATVSQMQSTADPYAGGTESQATSTAGEIERLRFMFKQVFGLTQWYRHDQAPTFSFSHMSAQALHLGSTGVPGGTDAQQNAQLARFPILTGPDHWTGIFWPHNTGHMAITIRDENHAGAGVKGGIELWRFHARGLIFHHTTALRFRHSLADSPATAHVTALELDQGTLGDTTAGNGAPNRLWLGHASVGLRVRSVDLHAGGFLQVGPEYHVTAGMAQGTSQFIFTSATVTTLQRGVVPVRTRGQWSMRRAPSPLNLSNSGLATSTLYYVYAFDNSGVLTLEASTTAHENDAEFGVEVKIGDPSRTLVGMLRTDGSSQFVNHASARLVASWFNKRLITAHAVATSSLSGTTASTSFVSFSNDLEIEVLTWDPEVVVAAAGGAVYNSVGTAFVYVAIARTNLGLIAPGASFGQSDSANQRILVGATGVFTGLTEGYYKFFLVWRVNTGTGTLDGSAAEGLATVIRATTLH